VEGGHEAAARVLVLDGAPLDAVATSGETALHIAARRGDEAIVRLLVAHGADVLPPDASGRPAGGGAGEAGHVSLAATLGAPDGRWRRQRPPATGRRARAPRASP